MLFCALERPRTENPGNPLDASVVSVMPAELCGYSGQKLMGAWSDTPQNAVEFADRILHIWTNSGNSYLVAVHVEAPTGTPAFDAASALLTEDFEIGLP